jgi:hypothetical protein
VRGRADDSAAVRARPRAGDGGGHRRPRSGGAARRWQARTGTDDARVGMRLRLDVGAAAASEAGEQPHDGVGAR